MNLYIHFLGYTTQGRCHDYFLLNEEFKPGLSWFEALTIWIDLGYQGFDKDYAVKVLHIPKKKARGKGKTLSEKDKAYNKKVSQTRVLVEHAIGRLKFFDILSSTFRNKKENYDDQVIYTITGLCNLNIKFKT